MRDFGKAIKYYRNKCSMTQTELAEKLSVSNQTVSKWETGVNAPAADVIADICNILSVSLADFFAYAESGEDSVEDLFQPNDEQPNAPTPSAYEEIDIAVNNTLGTTTEAAAANTAEAVVPPSGARAFWGRIKAKFGKDLPFFITAIVLGIAVFLSLLFSILSARTYSAEQIYEKVNPSVVCIYVNTSGGNKVSGSGFYIDGNGKAVTNYHVIEKAKTIYIYDYKGQRYDVTEVVSVDVDKDIAILQTEARSTPSVKIGNSDRVKTGEKVYAIGYPQSFILGNVDSTFTEGTVSKSSYSVKGINYIQSTVNITNGNSGGVLLNSRAEVIGITTAGLDLNDIDYMNFSVPINNVRSVKYKVNIPIENFATDFKFYTVNYYIGNSVYRSYTVLHNEILDEIVMPEEDGMAYVGWGKGGISGENYDFTQPVQSNLNLYLKRKSVYYNVSFSANGGTGTQEMDKCRYENKYTLPQCTMEKAAYKFIGWEYNGEIYNPGDRFENTTKISKVNFTALWERTGYFVTYVSDENRYEEVFSIGEAATLSECTFTKAGYKFAGWNIDGTNYNAGDKYSNADSTDNVNVYAMWEPISYTLILKNFKGKTLFSKTVLYTDFVYDIEIDDCEAGYEHSGWTDGTNEYPLGTFRMLTTEDGGTVIITPIRTPIEYNIKYYVTGVYATKSIRFDGNTVKSKYDGKSVYITSAYSTYGCIPSSPQLAEYGKLLFDGWDYYVNGELITGDNRYLTTDKTAEITAKDRWTCPAYKVNLFSQSNSAYPTKAFYLDGNQSFVLPNPKQGGFLKSGYNPVGWHIFTSAGDFDLEYDINLNNVMHYGYFIDETDLPYVNLRPLYTGCVWNISFDGNGGEGNMDDKAYTHRMGASTLLPYNEFTKEGYEFVCWEFNGKTYEDHARIDGVLIDCDADVVMKAVWKKADEASEEVI